MPEHQVVDKELAVEEGAEEEKEGPANQPLHVPTHHGCHQEVNVKRSLRKTS